MMKKLRAVLTFVLMAGITVTALLWSRCSQKPKPPEVVPFETKGRLQIYAVDVGQGDGLLIVTPNGKTVMVDAGTGQGGTAMLALLQRLNLNSIDLAVASHPHIDHIGGFRRVIERVPITTFLDSGQKFTSDEYQRLLLAIKEKKIKFVAAKRKMKFELDSGVQLEVLNPEGGSKWITDVRRGGSVENANSVVLRLSYGNFAMLFTGDAEAETEEVMISAGANLKAQVLKIGHHGSRYATSDSFLQAVAPQAAIISCGDNNRYGHPTQTTLDRLRSANITLYRTDLSGELTIVSDGKKFEISPARKPDLAAIWQGPTKGE